MVRVRVSISITCKKIFIVGVGVGLWREGVMLRFDMRVARTAGSNTAVVPVPIENFFFISMILYLLAL